MALVAKAFTSKLALLEKIDRIEHFDADGGGSITRTFYCEPYTAHKTAITALKGTVRPVNKAAPEGDWERVKPHNDPLYPHFFCTDVKVTPFAREAITGSKSTGFNKDEVDQLTETKKALDVIDDFDFASTPDNLDVADIADGGKDPVVSDGTTSTGLCGAFITATYNPLIFVQGLSSNVDEFDYVDPKLTPITRLTQLGRSLGFLLPQGGLGALIVSGGVSDTSTVPELLWEYTIRRLMVPKNPRITLAALSNKINSTDFIMGDTSWPTGTVKMETPAVQTCLAPDGQLYYNIDFKFTIRALYGDIYVPVETVPGSGVFQCDTPVEGWVDWNHMLGIPSSFGFQARPLGYYPVGWNSGLFQFFGPNRPLYLLDMDASTIMPAPLVSTLGSAPFKSGFKAGQ
jgi:hypothetical protein